MVSNIAEQPLVEMLNINVDDFIRKSPDVTPVILLERIGAAIVRRRTWYQPKNAPIDTDVSVLRLDEPTSMAHWHGKEIQLTEAEYGILQQLSINYGRPMNYSALQVLTAGERTDPMKARERLKTHIHNIREKFKGNGLPWPIKAVRGKGFVLIDK